MVSKELHEIVNKGFNLFFKEYKLFIAIGIFVNALRSIILKDNSYILFCFSSFIPTPVSFTFISTRDEQRKIIKRLNKIQDGLSNLESKISASKSLQQSLINQVF